MADNNGLKRRRRSDGTIAYYWIAAAVSERARDYPLKTIRIHAADDDEAAARARKLTTELHVWLTEQSPPASPFNGTIASLVDCYQRDEDSPYQSVKGNTRHHYDQILRIIRTDRGARRVDALTRKDFARWYREWRGPVIKTNEDGTTVTGAERVRRAHNCMKLVRIIVNFGASMRFDGCAVTALILAEMRFALPPPRRSQLSFDQALAVIDGALAAGRPSVALAQALQFELSLRQKDVIGEWTKTAPGESGIVYYRQRWSGGVLWSDLSPDLVLVKQTTKTAAVGEWNLALYPLVAKALAAFPADKRVGPMIVSESTGHPYRPDDFRVKWRALARAAGVPDDVWNMDSRAGGITEGDEAGAEPRDLQRHATHADFATTSRYVRGTLKSTEKVARLRVAGREPKNG